MKKQESPGFSRGGASQMARLVARVWSTLESALGSYATATIRAINIATTADRGE